MSTYRLNFTVVNKFQSGMLEFRNIPEAYTVVTSFFFFAINSVIIVFAINSVIVVFAINSVVIVFAINSVCNK